jgi:hypothetical protein
MTSKFLIVPMHALSILKVTVLLLIGGSVFVCSVYAQSSGAMVQQWEDREREIKIQFSHIPEKPIADSNTLLHFYIRNLTTGRQIENLRANVVIISDFQRASKFLNIPVSNGDFSLNSSFPYTGLNEIIVNLHKGSFGLALASFDVSVLAPPPSIDLLFQAILFGVGFPVAVMVVIITLLKRKRGNLIFK